MGGVARCWDHLGSGQDAVDPRVPRVSALARQRFVAADPQSPLELEDGARLAPSNQATTAGLESHLLKK